VPGFFALDPAVMIAVETVAAEGSPASYSAAIARRRIGSGLAEKKTLLGS
jgi:hypothetical protein